ncbi:hypothetical protein PtA15_2A911 [Puccinia triticina]|uniref:Cytochrome P450 n=1 Tax=Puccinia triticina TaxID=208348 RepID=A0ABY7CC26_9BASI|nr:uncharacterized protein PtA15_2A911 [Puccinia triticina]WAQ82594.1 hypothetical protein PtA15_2A911 [Puccinia triticina]
MTVHGTRVVEISKPEWIEYIQKTNFENYVKGPLFQTIMHDVFGDGIFVADGGAWKQAQQATSTIFSIKTFKDQIDFRFSTVAGWQVFMKLVSSIGKRMEASCRVLDDYAYSLIDEQMADLSQTSDGEKEEAEPTDLLGIFMHTHDERGGGLGRIELRDTALNLIIAGRDTTAEALSWNFFHLLMNRDFISKIRKEAFEILSENQGRVTYANYKRFVWTNATILEALRLHPSVPKGGPRMCLGMNLGMFKAVKVIVEVFKDYELDFAKGW